MNVYHSRSQHDDGFVVWGKHSDGRPFRFFLKDSDDFDNKGYVKAMVKSLKTTGLLPDWRQFSLTH